MLRAFVDSSVFFSACYSPTGASRAIILDAIRGNVTLVVSNYVIREVGENLLRVAPSVHEVFLEFLQTVPFEHVRPSKREVLKAATYTELKDAPIVAAAIRAKVDYLATLDRRHLVDKPEVSAGSGLSVVLPSELLQKIREHI
jgi:predicted nucleic acid-binding protein